MVEENVYIQSGNSVIGLPRFLKRRMISARLAAVQKLLQQTIVGSTPEGEDRIKSSLLLLEAQLFSD